MASTDLYLPSVSPTPCMDIYMYTRKYCRKYRRKFRIVFTNRCLQTSRCNVYEWPFANIRVQRSQRAARKHSGTVLQKTICKNPNSSVMNGPSFSSVHNVKAKTCIYPYKLYTIGCLYTTMADNPWVVTKRNFF